jgi:hypothetical protein
VARWSVDIIRKRLKHVGSVAAANEKQAVEEGVKQFKIAPATRRKIAVRKIADND